MHFVRLSTSICTKNYAFLIFISNMSWKKSSFFFILKNTNYFISLIQSILNKINSVCVSFLWYSIVWITKLQIYMFSIAYHACECYFLMHAWFDMWSIDACQIWFSFFFVLINAMVLLEFNINWRSESMGKRLYNIHWCQSWNSFELFLFIHIFFTIYLRRRKNKISYCLPFYI